MPHIVVLGGGIGGVSMAYDMRALCPDQKITVISDTPYFSFVPSNPWVAVNWRTREQIDIPLEKYLAKKGIDFIPVAAKRVHPESNSIELVDGQTVAYDYLVLATGPKLAFGAVEGLGPHGGFTHSICQSGHAEMASKAWTEFKENPGPVVVGAVQGVSCFGPAYEYAFILNHDLKKAKIRHRVPMTYITPEPYIGHLGLGGVGDSKSVLESMLRERDIKWICNAKVEKIEKGLIHVIEHDDLGNVKQKHEVPFSYSMMMPPFAGIDATMGIEGLVNEKGFAIIDDFQRNPTYKNVFAVGVCVAIAPREKTPIPVGVPKTGYMIESMVDATANNILDIMAGKEPTHKATWNAICLADMGDTGVAFVALPQIPPRNVAWMKGGKWVHWMKILFEWYFIRKVKTGSISPVYEKYVLKMLGINKKQLDQFKR